MLIFLINIKFIFAVKVKRDFRLYFTLQSSIWQYIYFTSLSLFFLLNSIAILCFSLKASNMPSIAFLKAIHSRFFSCWSSFSSLSPSSSLSKRIDSSVFCSSLRLCSSNMLSISSIWFWTSLSLCISFWFSKIFLIFVFFQFPFRLAKLILFKQDVFNMRWLWKRINRAFLSCWRVFF